MEDSNLKFVLQTNGIWWLFLGFVVFLGVFFPAFRRRYNRNARDLPRPTAAECLRWSLVYFGIGGLLLVATLWFP